MATCLDS